MNLAGTYADFTDQRHTVYSTTSYGDVRLWGPGNSSETLASKWNAEYYGYYLLQRALEGSNVSELCKWHFNLVTNYAFDEGMLKGLNVGGAYRWQDKVTIGYPVLVADDGSESYDINNPMKGDTESYLDLWVGYEHEINDDVTWRIQLNVKNLFSSDDLIPITLEPDGSMAAGRIPEATTWYITNTFSF
jgi:outer membrane receptor for ferric coprogen and ferric-rhodotorulic acid